MLLSHGELPCQHTCETRFDAEALSRILLPSTLPFINLQLQQICYLLCSSGDRFNSFETRFIAVQSGIRSLT